MSWKSRTFAILKEYYNNNIMKRVLFIFLLGCINASLARAQNISGEYITEWQWNMNKKTNWVNQLRLDLSIPFGNGKDSFEAATLHVDRKSVV